MAIDLLVPKPRLIVPKPKSCVALDMAMDGASAATLFDKSRYRSHGAITGAAWATGLHGKALDFNPNTPSYVEIPASYTQLNFTSEDFSIIVRVYIDTFPESYIRFFQRGLLNADGWRFSVRDTGVLHLLTSQLNAYQWTLSAAGAVTTGAWLTLGATRDGAAVKLYINGVDSTVTPAVHVNPTTCSRTAKIGIHDNLIAYPMDGKIEFLRIFRGVALSTSEHLAYHNALA